MLVTVFACGEPTAPTHSADGAFRMVGQYGSELTGGPIPLAVLNESDAWTGSPESLPRVTVYDDGTVLVVRPAAGGGGEIAAGTVDDPAGLAARIAHDLADLPPRVEITHATDQPEVAVSARVGDVWRTVNVVGFASDAAVAEPPPAFVAAREALVALDAGRPYAPRDYRVTLSDDSVPSRDAIAWPADVPAPPPGLVPDERYLGRPRVYRLAGDAGAALRVFARSTNAGAVETPAGDRVQVHVTAGIPADDLLEALRYCSPSEREPLHDCDRRLPGRP